MNPVLPAMGTPAPLTIGRYAFYGQIAAGGMATVHFARLVGPGNFSRIVAAKRLLPHLLQNKDFTDMLLDEARLAARIHHPNVVSTLDVVSTGDELVVVMEYVHGESLAKLARTAKDLDDGIPPSIATTIAIDALHGLHAAHEVRDESGALLGLVHRDVSPQNLMVGVDGVTRIADFGIAKAAGRSQETRDGTVKGKLTYMAPEQIERGELTRATDIFALSVVLWEMLTGQRLFEGKTDGEVLRRILLDQVPPPSSRAPNVPQEYDEILARGLARDPADRYKTAREMALALEAISTPVRASEIGAWVERNASATIVSRARTITQIERTPERTSAPPAAPTTRAITPAAVVAESQSANQGTGTNAAWARPSSGRKANRIWLAALALLLCGGGVFAYLQLHPGPDSAEVAKSPVLLTAAEPIATAPAAPAATAPAATPVTAAPATAAPVAAAPVTAAPVTAAPATTAPPSNGNPAGVTRPRRADPPPPAKHTASSADDCDPPYSIDASGRHIFKLKCVQ